MLQKRGSIELNSSTISNQNGVQVQAIYKNLQECTTYHDTMQIHQKQDRFKHGTSKHHIPVYLIQL